MRLPEPQERRGPGTGSGKTSKCFQHSRLPAAQGCSARPTLPLRSPGERRPSGPGTARTFFLGPQGHPGPTWCLLRFLHMHRFGDSGGGSRSGRPPCSIRLRPSQWGLCSRAAREGGQAMVSRGNRLCEARAPSCRSPTLLWTRDKKSFMGRGGES